MRRSPADSDLAGRQQAFHVAVGQLLRRSPAGPGRTGLPGPRGIAVFGQGADRRAPGGSMRRRRDVVHLLLAGLTIALSAGCFLPYRGIVIRIEESPGRSDEAPGSHHRAPPLDVAVIERIVTDVGKRWGYSEPKQQDATHLRDVSYRTAMFRLVPGGTSEVIDLDVSTDGRTVFIGLKDWAGMTRPSRDAVKRADELMTSLRAALPGASIESIAIKLSPPP